MLNRRKFLKQAGLGTGAVLASGYVHASYYENTRRFFARYNDYSASQLVADEDFWGYIQQCYTIAPGIINLNNGGVAPAPKVVQDAMKRYYDLSNEAPSYYMWRVLDLGREPLRKNLAQLAGCSPDEIAIQRNASEALETVIFGLNLKRGDEVVLSKQDYPNMISAWKQREERDGIKLVWVNLELPSEDDNYLVNSFVSRFTSRTKLVQVTHMINWIGQKLPVKKIADVAHAKGIEVLVDGAHTFAQFDFTIPDLGCDYFGTSLHKWLSAPIGTGMLYVRSDKIKNLYPLFGSGDAKGTDIRKYEHLGTRPFYIEQAIDKAIDFHEMIGVKRKEARLQYLKNYWMGKVKDVPGVKLHTSFNPAYACAIGLVSVEGQKPSALDGFLMDNYKIHVVGIEWENIKGVRITPNVYTSLKNLDRLVEGITDFAKSRQNG
jgi:selenocysteine lyase/cysteine desulfurase